MSLVKLEAAAWQYTWYHQKDLIEGPESDTQIWSRRGFSFAKRTDVQRNLRHKATFTPPPKGHCVFFSIPISLMTFSVAEANFCKTLFSKIPQLPWGLHRIFDHRLEMMKLKSVLAELLNTERAPYWREVRLVQPESSHPDNDVGQSFQTRRRTKNRCCARCTGSVAKNEEQAIMKRECLGQK